MTYQSSHSQAHWQNVYRTRGAESVSWFRPHLEVSLELLTQGGLTATSRMIDIGGGASTLVDDLLDRGVRDITVLDISQEALDVAQRRLGESAKVVHWYAGDALEAVLPPAGFDFWHDRAVLHFLTDDADAHRYARQAANALAPGGCAVISGFAPEGPERCSGLAVARRSAEDIAAIFAPAFTLVRQKTERHRTPGGSEQVFAYALLRRG